MSDEALDAIDARLAALRAEVEYAMKTTTGIGIRRAEFELEELREELSGSRTTSAKHVAGWTQVKDGYWENRDAKQDIRTWGGDKFYLSGYFVEGKDLPYESPGFGSLEEAQAAGAKFSSKRTAHVSEDPTIISHCPFCGSGGITGRSDGGADCDLCGRAFTVMEQPLFSNTPGTGPSASVPVTPFDPLMQQTPFADGAAGSGAIPGQDPALPPGTDPTAAGGGDGDNPFAKKDDSGGDDSGDKSDKKPAFLSNLKAHNGTPLSADDFVLHHAIRLNRG